MKQSTQYFRLGTITMLLEVVTNVIMVVMNKPELVFFIPVFLGAGAAFGLAGYRNLKEEKDRRL